MIAKRGLAWLSGAKERHEPWAEIARVVRAGLAEELDKDTLAGDGFLGRAARVSGYTTNMLARYVSVLTFAERTAAQGPTPLHALESVPFAILEIVKRVGAVDPDTAKEMSREAAAGRLSLARVREIQKTVIAEKGAPFSSKGSAARKRSALERQIKDLVVEHLPQFTRVSDALFSERPSPINFVRVDAIAFRLDGKREDFIDSFHVRVFPDRASRTLIDDVVARAVVASVFYRHTWIVLLPTVPQLDRVVQIMDTLAFHWMGLAVADLIERKFDFVQRPKGEPAFSRSRLMHLALLQRL